MSVFAYDPAAMKNWADGVIKILNGDSDSVGYCSKKFGEQIEKLVQPNVWTGAAALKNYENFMTTHSAMLNFINSFGNAFQDAITQINASVANLEISNLGETTNVASTFGTLSYAQITELSKSSISTETVRYDYNTIVNIGGELNNIFMALDNAKSKLTNQINLIADGTGIWDGVAAEKTKASLLEVLNKNMPNVMDSLNVCINNIKEAAEAAKMADR